MNLGKFSFSAELNEVKRFQDLEDYEKEIVFYSENKNSIFIFESIIEELITKYSKNICYVTSSKDELNFKNKKIKTFFIGDGIARTKFFLNLKTKILIMTMPDLETFHIKKSKIYPVHYVYIFHAMVSTHLVYRKKAFDHYDSILCVGQYQIDEIRNAEKIYNLKPKKLFHSGYTHLDNLIKKNAEKKDKITKDNNQILIAPSWGETGLFETVIEEVIRELLDAKYKVILRPHPMTLKLSKKKIALIQKLFSVNPNFKLELDLPNFDSLLFSDIMISDWSGIALEFAFAFEKPILYIDVPKKIHNKDFKDITQIPIEESIRDKIGKIILPSEIKQISKEIEMLKQQTFERKDMIRKIRDKEIFNIGNSGKKSASDIIELLNQLK
jgi:CDP-glycerol glycerophosphotransferase (TagB/SpsB family)